MPQGVRSAVVILGLGVLLVVVGVWGWRTATEPFPGKADAPKCIDRAVTAGDKVFPDQVTVSVYNASERNGLAGRTMNELVEAGFGEGDTGNAPKDSDVPFATIWTEHPRNPDVLLVASHLGAAVEVERRNGRGVGVTVLVGDGFEKLVKGERRVVAAEDATICSPPVS